MLKKPDKDFDKFLSKLKEIQKEVRKIYDDFDILLKGCYTQKDKQDYYKRWFEGLTKAGYTSTNFTQEDYVNLCDVETFDPQKHEEHYQEFKKFLELHEGIKEVYRPYKKLYDDVGEHFLDINYLSNMPVTEFNFAVAFVVLHTSLVSGAISCDQSLVSPPKFRKLNIDLEFAQLREAYNKIEIVPNAQYGASAMDLLKDPTYNTEDTLAYLDSPYVATMGYTIVFDIVDMIDLIDACKKFQGKFIFSCRVNLPIAALKDKKSKNIFVRFMSEWFKTDYKVLFLRELFNGVKKEVPKNSKKKYFNISARTTRKLLRENKYNNDYLFLASCIELGQDLELMIINFDFKVPNYQDFLELFKKRKGCL